MLLRFRKSFTSATNVEMNKIKNFSVVQAVNLIDVYYNCIFILIYVSLFPQTGVLRLG